MVKTQQVSTIFAKVRLYITRFSIVAGTGFLMGI